MCTMTVASSRSVCLPVLIGLWKKRGGIILGGSTGKPGFLILVFVSTVTHAAVRPPIHPGKTHADVLRETMGERDSCKKTFLLWALTVRTLGLK